jgi:hypothetical protein
MLQTIEVAILDSEGKVLVTLALRPFGLTWPRRGAASVLEAPRGSFARWGLKAGSIVTYGTLEQLGPNVAFKPNSATAQLSVPSGEITHPSGSARQAPGQQAEAEHDGREQHEEHAG